MKRENTRAKKERKFFRRSKKRAIKRLIGCGIRHLNRKGAEKFPAGRGEGKIANGELAEPMGPSQKDPAGFLRGRENN